MEDYSENCRKECEDRLSGVWSKEDGARVIVREKTEHPVWTLHVTDLRSCGG